MKLWRLSLFLLAIIASNLMTSKGFRGKLLCKQFYPFLDLKYSDKMTKMGKWKKNLFKLVANLGATGSLLFLLPMNVRGSDKLINLSESDIAHIVEEDITKRQALFTADFTRAIYDESCRFQDEIDIYPLPQYMHGTKALFDPHKSHVELTTPVTVSSDEEGHRQIQFQFRENLAFNLPLLKPAVSLSGRVALKRDPTTGLIIFSREQWNESILEILRSLHL